MSRVLVSPRWTFIDLDQALQVFPHSDFFKVTYFVNRHTHQVIRRTMSTKYIYSPTLGSLGTCSVPTVWTMEFNHWAPTGKETMFVGFRPFREKYASWTGLLYEWAHQWWTAHVNDGSIPWALKRTSPSCQRGLLQKRVHLLVPPSGRGGGGGQGAGGVGGTTVDGTARRALPPRCSLAVPKGRDKGISNGGRIYHCEKLKLRTYVITVCKSIWTAPQ